MGDDWCPIGGVCVPEGCWDDSHGRCDTHNCPLISQNVLREIRDEARRPLETAIDGWQTRVAELEGLHAVVCAALTERIGEIDAKTRRVAALEADAEKLRIEGADQFWAADEVTELRSRVAALEGELDRLSQIDRLFEKVSDEL